LYATAFGSVGTLCLLFGAGFLGGTVLADVRTVASLRVLALSLLPISYTSVFSGYFVGIKKVACNAAVQVVAQLSKIAFTVFLVTNSAKKGTAAAVVALSVGIVGTELISFLVMTVEYLIERKGGKGSGGNDIGEVLKMALPLAFSAYIRSGLLSLEHILIPKRLRDHGETASQAVTLYGLLHGMALPLILYPMSPLSSFSGLLVPEFAESSAAGDKPRLERIAGECMNTTLAYATALSVLLFVFSEELGYVIYHSYDAGRYIAMLAPVVPLMYLDHVTDSMLKGVGEHVFSMWVNITDSALSVILVWLLIPKMGINGYAIVIIVMEAYNFILSVFRLKSKVWFTINLLNSMIIPSLSAFFASALMKHAFLISGTGTTALWLILKGVFTVCVFVACNTVLTYVVRTVAKAKKRNRACR
jgi:stage V sporulation protein B